MNKWLASILLTLFPVLSFSDSSLSFTPPASDYSIVFLGNIFGVVDGVLHGTGSQIMGTMASVFNSAVLALGGIIIMYTLLVSTMNTAHEGQMLGQKWSSIWIPVRSTFGIALLMPKASGYCLMQIFVMWVVVQGVGAADKIWGAALSYLNRGGVLIMAQSNPSLALQSVLIPAGNSSPPLPKAVMTILLGEVCMMSLQKELEQKRTEYLNQKQNQTGPCYNMTDPLMYDICNSPVPDFLSTVNFIDAQSTAQSTALANGHPVQQPFTLSMPNLMGNAGNGQALPYHQLNGFCGTVQWNQIQSLSQYTGQIGAPTQVGPSITLTSSELETSQMSRAIALQQVYLDMNSVAQTIVGNAPFLQQGTTGTAPASNFSPVSQQQFGVPYMQGTTVCPAASAKCTTWGAAPSSDNNSYSVLFNGTEFLGAINDYNGIMFPVLNLTKQINSLQMNSSARQFINTALTQGWILAGSYFFNLVRLNGNAITGANQQDSHTGLDGSTPLNVKNYSPDSKEYAILCDLLGGGVCQGTVLATATTALNNLKTLINGSTLSSGPLATPVLSATTGRTLIAGQASSTVYGFINNSLMMTLPAQPGIKPVQFNNTSNFQLTTVFYTLPTISFSCGNVSTFLHSFCMGYIVGNLFYNVIIRSVYNTMIDTLQSVISKLISSFITVPMKAIAGIFVQGVTVLQSPGVNPIIALANMGTMYINFSGNLWMGLMASAVVSSLIPMVGVFVFALMSFVMPLVLSWVGIMCSVGFTTAYYIPLLPYMIFTFGALAWLMTVVEAMVAAPIVALGVTHPEGHDAFGKGEAAVMLLMNVFLRPAMMIIGYISAISLSYVGVWLLNAGFEQAITFISNESTTPSSINALGSYCGANTNNSICAALMSNYTYTPPAQQGGGTSQTSSLASLVSIISDIPIYGTFFDLFGGNELTHPNSNRVGSAGIGSGSANYQDWAGMYAFFFSILIYTTTYLTIVQNAFGLISSLPDKVLRWIGGSPESIGAESARWGDEVKGKIGEAGKGTQDAQGQMGKQAGAYGQKAIGAAKKGLSKGSSSGDVSAEGSDSSADSGDGDS